MPIVALDDSSLQEVIGCATAIVAACGYEHRSSEIAPLLRAGTKERLALAFEEHPTTLARADNEKAFRGHNFKLLPCSGGSSDAVLTLVAPVLKRAIESNGVVAFEISSMTRVWHAAIVRLLASESHRIGFQTYFIYIPGKFSPPPTRTTYNEIVAPLSGFSSLTLPSKPGALVMGLGYERDRALGLGEVLDPSKTLLMIPRYGQDDPYYAEVRRSNLEIIETVDNDCVFEYPLNQPTATFGMLESICGGLQNDYRVVLASLGPKLFGLICLLIAAKRPVISVWRVSSGVHGEPRDVPGDIERAIAVKVSWGPR